MNMTLKNDSKIPATLILDLRERDNLPKEYDGIECIEIIRNKESDQDDDDECMV